jgi:diaminopimelate decarboxylase
VSTRFEGFQYRNHVLELSGVNLEEIAAQVGTPFYAYSADLILKQFADLDSSFGTQDHLICYAVKANSNLAILKLLAQAGSGAEVVSGGELFRALAAGFSPDKIIFDGVGKSREEIEYAFSKKILFFNVESEQELVSIDCVAKQCKKVAPVAFRLNPDVNPKTHPYIATGLRKSKFGIPHKKAGEIFKAANRLKNIQIVGIGCHIGSQIVQIGPYIESIKRMLQLYDKYKEKNFPISYLNMGGGLGITYKNEKPPSLQAWVQSLIKEMNGRPPKILIEPGRALVGNAGALVTKVNFVKRGESDNFIITDAGMNDLIRPALYEAYHSILPIRYKRYKKIKASVVGPVCETSDVLAFPRRIQNFQQGDLLSIMSCGAYAASMGSQYNSRPRPPEILIADGKWHIIRERETFDDLIQKEKIPDFLQKKMGPHIAVNS